MPRVVFGLFVSLATLHSAAAQTADNATIAGAILGNLPTCKAMLTNCISFAKRAQMAAGPGGVIPVNISRPACYDMYRQADQSGTWPDNQPFGFAMACTTDKEQYQHHFRHHRFGDGNGNANATPIADPAATPTTPPIAPATPAANTPAPADPTAAQATDTAN